MLTAIILDDTHMKTLKITDETHKLLTMAKGELIASTGDPNLTYDDAINSLVGYWREGKQSGRDLTLKPYYFVRYTWWRRVDMDTVEKEMRGVFEVENLVPPDDRRNMSPYGREKLRVRADTLGAYLAPERAVMYQREPQPFTARDLELRKRIFELYTRDRATPLPLFFQDEPKFEVPE